MRGFEFGEGYYPPNPNPSAASSVYVDSDWAGCRETGKSTNGGAWYVLEGLELHADAHVVD